MTTATFGTGKRSKRLAKRLALVLLAIVALLSIALLTNALILTGQTKAAHLTGAGTELIHTPQGTLQVLDQGEQNAPPIVLIHGVAGSLHWWDKITPLLTAHYRVIRMDLLGGGGSENPSSGHYTVEDQAAAVGEMLQHLGVKHATIVGHSLGGAVATSLAEQYPGEVALYWLLRTSVRERNPLSFHHPPLSLCQVVLSHRSRGRMVLMYKRKQASMGSKPSGKACKGRPSGLSKTSSDTTRRAEWTSSSSCLLAHVSPLQAAQ